MILLRWNFLPKLIGPDVEAASRALPDGGVLLVENVRFFKEEEANEDGFAQALAKLGDVYVNDAFGAAHRAHASTAGVARYLPQAAMGLLMERELQYLKEELAHPDRPFLVILGGSKVSDKIGVIKALMEKADVFLIGGAMAHTFFKAMGIPTGASRIEADKVHLAEELLNLAKEKGIKFFVPIDCIETDEFKAGANSRNTPFSRRPRESLKGGKRLISAGRRLPFSRRKSHGQRRYFGTDRLGFLKSRISPMALGRSLRLSRNPMPRQSSAGEIL